MRALHFWKLWSWSFIYQDPYPTFNGGGSPFHGTAIRELSVFGGAPKPASAKLGMAGLMVGLCRRKRRGADG